MPFSRQLFSTVIALGLCSAAPAALLELSGPPVRTVELGDLKIPVRPEAKTTAPEVATLKLTGAGIRKKTIFAVKVYLLASYVSSPEKVDPQKPLESLEKSTVKALHLTFTRDISAEKIRDSFKESLTSNGADLSSPPLKELFSKLDQSVKKGDTLSIVGVHHDSGDELAFEFPGSKFTVKGKGLTNLFWKIWFGEPTDGGLKDLKKELLVAK